MDTEPSQSIQPERTRTHWLKKARKMVMPASLLVAGSMALHSGSMPSAGESGGTRGAWGGQDGSRTSEVGEFDTYNDLDILHDPSYELLFTPPDEDSNLGEFVTALEQNPQYSSSTDRAQITRISFVEDAWSVTPVVDPNELAELADLGPHILFGGDTANVPPINLYHLQSSGLTETKLKKAREVFVVAGFVVTRGKNGSYSFYDMPLRHQISVENVSAEDVRLYSDFITKHVASEIDTDRTGVPSHIDQVVNLAYRGVDKDELDHLLSYMEMFALDEETPDLGTRWSRLLDLYLKGQTLEARKQVLDVIVHVLVTYQRGFFTTEEGESLTPEEARTEEVKRYDLYIADILRYFSGSVGSKIIRSEHLEIYSQLFDGLMREYLSSNSTDGAFYRTKEGLDVSLDFTSIAPYIEELIDKDALVLITRFKVPVPDIVEALKSSDPEKELGKLVYQAHNEDSYRKLDLPIDEKETTVLLEATRMKGLSVDEVKDAAENVQYLKMTGGSSNYNTHGSIFINFIVDIARVKKGHLSPDDLTNLASLMRVLGAHGALYVQLSELASSVTFSNQRYETQEDVLDMVFDSFNANPAHFNSKGVSHLINKLHDYAGTSHTEDLRPYMIDKLTNDGMITLIANGGAHLPKYYYDTSKVLSPKAKEDISVGDHDYGIAMYTSTFEMIYARLQAFQKEDPDEYRALLGKDKDLLRRYTFMLGRFGHLDEEVALNPDVFRQAFIDTLSVSTSTTDWEIAIDGLVTGLNSPESEAYQQAILDIYWGVSNRPTAEGRAAIAYLVKRVDVLRTGRFKEFFQERFAEYPEPQALKVPDWSQKKIIHVGLFYNADEVREEGLPGALTEYQKDGFHIVHADRESLLWKLQKTLPDGRIILVEVSTRSSEDVEKDNNELDFVAVLSHSYNYEHFFRRTENRAFWDDTVFYNGFCGSAKQSSTLIDLGYSGPKVGDKDIANGFVNLLATMRLLDELTATEQARDWSSVNESLGSFGSSWGISLPSIDQEMTQYIIENRNNSLDAYFDSKWNDYWRKLLSPREVASVQGQIDPHP